MWHDAGCSELEQSQIPISLHMLSSVFACGTMPGVPNSNRVRYPFLYTCFRRSLHVARCRVFRTRTESDTHFFTHGFVGPCMWHDAGCSELEQSQIPISLHMVSSVLACGT